MGNPTSGQELFKCGLACYRGDGVEEDYEQIFGETRRLAEAEGKEDSAVFAVLGVKILF